MCQACARTKPAALASSPKQANLNTRVFRARPRRSRTLRVVASASAFSAAQQCPGGIFGAASRRRATGGASSSWLGTGVWQGARRAGATCPLRRVELVAGHWRLAGCQAGGRHLPPAAPAPAARLVARMCVCVCVCACACVRARVRVNTRVASREPESESDLAKDTQWNCRNAESPAGLPFT
jgi:hypothetical protein